jgi:DNA polymerase III alpha subunit (gram-positive type)
MPESGRDRVFLDIETTGITAEDEIVSICMIKHRHEGPPQVLYIKCKPYGKIPKRASQIHGIYHRHVKNLPHFSEYLPQIMEFGQDCDIIGYNIWFDLNIINVQIMNAHDLLESHNKPLEWAIGNVYDLYLIYHHFTRDQRITRKLGDCYEALVKEKFKNAHSAIYDTVACIEILEMMSMEYFNNLDWTRIASVIELLIHRSPFLREGKKTIPGSNEPFPTLVKDKCLWTNIYLSNKVALPEWMRELIPPMHPAQNFFTIGYENTEWSAHISREIFNKTLNSKYHFKN